MDRQSGALKLELQQGMPPAGRIAAKALVLLAGWMTAMLPAFVAILLWKTYGGTVYVPKGTVEIMSSSDYSSPRPRVPAPGWPAC